MTEPYETEQDVGETTKAESKVPAFYLGMNLATGGAETIPLVAETLEDADREAREVFEIGILSGEIDFDNVLKAGVISREIYEDLKRRNAEAATTH